MQAEGWKVNWSDRRSHILKAYMIKRKAGRADWGELPRNYDRLEQGKKLERQQEVNSPGKKQKVHMMEL